MFVIMGGAGKRDKLLFPLFIAHIFCFLDFIFSTIPVSGIKLKPRQKADSAGYSDRVREKTGEIKGNQFMGEGEKREEASLGYKAEVPPATRDIYLVVSRFSGGRGLSCTGFVKKKINPLQLQS
jgi:hypothetical protein